MTTPLDILNLALFDAGVVGTGQTASAQDIQQAFTRMNFMLAEWNRKRWLIYHLVDVAKVSTGAQSYTVGPAGDFNVSVRPDRLEAAFFRQLVQSQPNQIDYPLNIVESRETYNEIALKNLTSFPDCIFYDPVYPVGVVYPWPIPQAAIYEVHLTLKEVLAQFANLNQVISLPNEYFSALHWNMAVRLRAGYDLPPRPDHITLAKDALNTIRGANAAISRLKMPTELVRPGIYNPYSDQIR